MSEFGSKWQEMVLQPGEGMSSSYRPGSLLPVGRLFVSGAAGSQQHPGHTAFPCRVTVYKQFSLSFRKIERAFLHRLKRRPMNVIFYLLFSVG